MKSVRYEKFHVQRDISLKENKEALLVASKKKGLEQHFLNTLSACIRPINIMQDEYHNTK
jgi:hypothetical protein